MVMQEAELLLIGKIVAAQGLKGEVKVYPDSDFPERFEKPGKRWLLRPGQTTAESVELLQGRFVPNQGVYIVKLAGSESREQAEELRGCRLMVHQSDRPQLAEGEFHVADLVGLEVFNQQTSENIGKVTDILTAGHDLLEVELYASPGEENHPKLKKVLIPFVMAIAPIVDLENRRIEIDPPAGLLELN